MKKIIVKNRIFYYKKVMPNVYNDLDGVVYELFNCSKKHIFTFPYYSDLLYFINHGVLMIY